MPVSNRLFSILCIFAVTLPLLGFPSHVRTMLLQWLVLHATLSSSFKNVSRNWKYHWDREQQILGSELVSIVVMVSSGSHRILSRRRNITFSQCDFLLNEYSDRRCTSRRSCKISAFRRYYEHNCTNREFWTEKQSSYVKRDCRTSYSRR